MVKHTRGDPQAVRRFAEEFVDRNPGSSQNDCLKALNNSRGGGLGPMVDVVSRVYLAHRQRKHEAMMTLPSKDSGPNGAKPVIPAFDDPKPVQLKGDDIRFQAKHPRADGSPSNVLAQSPIIPQSQILTPPKEDMAPNVKPTSPLHSVSPTPTTPANLPQVPDEKTAIANAARSLLAAMRLHNIESVILTVSDPDPEGKTKPVVEYSPTRRRPPTSFTIEL